jgi:hypothetical protein
VNYIKIATVREFIDSIANFKINRYGKDFFLKNTINQIKKIN